MLVYSYFRELVLGILFKLECFGGYNLQYNERVYIEELRAVRDDEALLFWWRERERELGRFGGKLSRAMRIQTEL